MFQKTSLSCWVSMWGRGIGEIRHEILGLLLIMIALVCLSVTASFWFMSEACKGEIMKPRRRPLRWLDSFQNIFGREALHLITRPERSHLARLAERIRERREERGVRHEILGLLLIMIALVCLSVTASFWFMSEACKGEIMKPRRRPLRWLDSFQNIFGREALHLITRPERSHLARLAERIRERREERGVRHEILGLLLIMIALVCLSVTASFWFMSEACKGEIMKPRRRPLRCLDSFQNIFGREALRLTLCIPRGWYLFLAKMRMLTKMLVMLIIYNKTPQTHTYLGSI